MKPLTDEDLWGIPEDEMPDPERYRVEPCPLVGDWCSSYEHGHCLQPQCVMRPNDAETATESKG